MGIWFVFLPCSCGSFYGIDDGEDENASRLVGRSRRLFFEGTFDRPVGVWGVFVDFLPCWGVFG